MAKLTVWIIGGTTIPAGVPDARCGSRSGDTITQDVWMELSGSEAELKSDYKLITGETMSVFPTSKSSPTGEGHYFGGAAGNPDGE